MTNTYRGFLRANTDGRFKVIASRIAPESLLATECLVHKLYQIKHLIGGHVLDVGCSTKPYKPMFNGNIAQYIGVDVPFSEHSKVFIDVFGRAEHLPFRDNSFNTVLLTEVLEHVPEPTQALREIARVTAQGGCIIISVPFMYRVHEAPYDFYRYTPYSLNHMASTVGLQIKEIKHRGGYLTVLADITNKGCALVFGSVRRILKLSAENWPSKILDFVQRSLLTPWQKLQWLLLRGETLASERYTLGYIFVLEKAKMDSSQAGNGPA